MLARWTGGELRAAPVLRGHRRRAGRVRVGLLPPAAAPAGGRGERRRGRRGRAVLGALPREAAAAARDRRTTARDAAGAPRRRGRPRRRRVRGVPARDPLRLVDLGARARRCPRRGAAGRGAHVEPHARRARRAEAPLPLPLDRAPRLRARARDPARCARPRCPTRSRARSRPRSRRCAASSCTSRPASPRRSTGRRRSRRSATERIDEHSVDVTLGTILKYREDQERVREHGVGELVRDRGGTQCLTHATVEAGSRSRSRSRACCAARASTCRSARR